MQVSDETSNLVRTVWRIRVTWASEWLFLINMQMSSVRCFKKIRSQPFYRRCARVLSRSISSPTHPLQCMRVNDTNIWWGRTLQAGTDWHMSIELLCSQNKNKIRSTQRQTRRILHSDIMCCKPCIMLTGYKRWQYVMCLAAAHEENRHHTEEHRTSK